MAGMCFLWIIKGSNFYKSRKWSIYYYLHIIDGTTWPREMTSKDIKLVNDRARI